MELVRSSISIASGLPRETVRSAPAITFSGPAQRSLTLRPARSRSRQATLYIESSDSFVASAAASIATGWSEPVPGRELRPLKSSAFHGALFRQVAQSIKSRFETPGCCLIRGENEKLLTQNAEGVGRLGDSLDRSLELPADRRLSRVAEAYPPGERQRLASGARDIAGGAEHRQHAGPERVAFARRRSLGGRNRKPAYLRLSSSQYGCVEAGTPNGAVSQRAGRDCS